MRFVFAALFATACNEYQLEDIPQPNEGATIEVAPKDLAFGTLELGEESSKVFTVTNKGPADVNLEGLDLVNSAAFVISQGITGTLLAQDESTEVTVTYTATTADDYGSAIVHSDAVNSEVWVDFSGAARVPLLVVEPPVLEFESEDGGAVEELATVRNEGKADLLVELHYVEGDFFEADKISPYTLGPGEEVEVPITYQPLGVGEAQGKLWVKADSGQGTVELRGDYNTCYGLAEAWDHGWIEAAYTSSGYHELRNLSEEEVCMDSWMAFFTDTSQDASLGDPLLGGDDTQYLTIEPEGTLVFDYGPNQLGEPWWFCIEETQVTTPTTSFWFYGSRIPQPLRGYMLSGSWDGQYDTWAHIASNVVVLAGRPLNVFSLEPDEVVDIEVLAMNLGRAGGGATLVETVPAHLSVLDTSPPATSITNNGDGTTTLMWDVSLVGALDTPEYEPTIYDIATYKYTAQLVSCPSVRNVGEDPEAYYADVDGTERISRGSPLVVMCDPDA